MKLKDCNVEYCDSIDVKLESILGENYIVKRFHSDDYDRDYDVFKCMSSETSVVLKKTNDIDEVYSYRILRDLNDENTPNIYFIEKKNDEYWLAIEYLEPFSENWGKRDIVELSVRLATIHSSISEDKTSLDTLKKWKYTATTKDVLYTLIDSDLTREHIDIIYESQEILRKAHQTFIHGDMIPLNMIVSKEGVRIIDWECGHIGPYILDIGRLLADYNIDKPWINPDWENDILRTYHQTLIERGRVITYDQMFLEYQCARLDNYFGIVRAFKTRKWERTEWYDLNLNQLINTIDTVNQLLTNSV